MAAPPSPRTQRRVMACGDLAFAAAWSALPTPASEALAKAGLRDPCVWAHIVPDGIEDIPGFLVNLAKELCGELSAPCPA